MYFTIFVQIQHHTHNIAFLMWTPSQPQHHFLVILFVKENVTSNISIRAKMMLFQIVCGGEL